MSTLHCTKKSRFTVLNKLIPLLSKSQIHFRFLQWYRSYLTLFFNSRFGFFSNRSMTMSMNPLSIARWRAVRLSSRNLRLNVAVKIDDSRQVAVCKANFHEELTESLEFTSAYLSSSILTMFAFPDRTADARIQLPYLGEERSIINVITSLNSHTIRTKRNENNSFPSLTYQID